MFGKLFAAVLVVSAVATMVVAIAAGRPLVSYSYNATGIETSIPVDNTSTFAGVAGGSSGFAVWSTSVPHAPLNACGTTAVLPGGSFSLTGTHGVRLAGAFTGGTVTAPAGFCGGSQPPCQNESFAINGQLTFNGTLTGEFSGTLTHDSTMLFGSCVTYFATISAHLTVG